MALLLTRLRPLAIRGGGMLRQRGAEWAALLPVERVDVMKRAVVALGQLVRRCEGQDLLEYGLLAALIAVFAIASISELGQTIYNLFWRDIGQAI
jgi:Flp pilus assembly pilin Flp